MSATVLINGNGNVNDPGSAWTVEEDATPIAVDDTFGGVGQITLTGGQFNGDPTRQDTRFIASKSATFTHDSVDEANGQTALGSIQGTVTGLQTKGQGASFGIVPLLGLLSGVTVNALPTGQQNLSAIFAVYVALATPQITVNFTASSDPLRVYGAWSGDLWTMLKQLASVNRVELALIGAQLTVRDLGSTILALDDEQACALNIPALPTCQQFQMTIQNTTAVSSGSSTVINYSQNPSLETNTTGWSAAGNSITGAGSSTTHAAVGTKAYTGTVTELAVNEAPHGQPAAYAAIGTIVFSHTIDVSSVAAGTVMSASMACYGVSTRPVVSASLQVAWLDASSNTISTSSAGAGVNCKSKFGTASVSNLVVPSGAVTAVLQLTGVARTVAPYPASPPSLTTAQFWADSAMLVPGAITSYFDGSLGGIYSWVGTANNSQSQYTATPGQNEFYNANADSNAIYSVNAGEISVTTIQTTNDPTALFQPIQSNTFPIATGQYYVCDSNNVPVTAAQWSAAGASVSVAIGTVPGTINLIIEGPSGSISGTVGPYYLRTSDSAGLAQLSIAGVGVKSNPVTITMYTGADPSDCPNVVGPAINSPFITDVATAYSVCVWSASNANGGVQNITGSIPTVQLAGFGLSAGALMTWQGCIYRVATVTIGKLTTTFTANWYHTIGAGTIAGRTLGQHKTLWGDAGYTNGDYKIKPLRTS